MTRLGEALTVFAVLALAWAVVAQGFTITNRGNLAGFEVPSTRHGTLSVSRYAYVIRDARVRLRWTKDAAQFFYLEAPGVTVEQRGHKQIVTLRDHPSVIVRDERDEMRRCDVGRVSHDQFVRRLNEAGILTRCDQGECELRLPTRTYWASEYVGEIDPMEGN